MITHNQEETMGFAAKIARGLKGGEVFALSGELGGGKTTFTKGLAEALKVEETITSPTFVILKAYPAKIGNKKIQFVHIDAYRCDNIEDVKSVGIEDYLGRKDVLLVVEWAEKIKDILPKNIINISFKLSGENTREIIYDSIN